MLSKESNRSDSVLQVMRDINIVLCALLDWSPLLHPPAASVRLVDTQSSSCRVIKIEMNDWKNKISLFLQLRSSNMWNINGLSSFRTILPSPFHLPGFLPVSCLITKLSLIARSWRELRCSGWWREETSWKRECAQPGRQPRGLWRDSAWTASRRAQWTMSWGASSSVLWPRSCLRTNPGHCVRKMNVFIDYSCKVKLFSPESVTDIQGTPTKTGSVTVWSSFVFIALHSSAVGCLDVFVLTTPELEVQTCLSLTFTITNVNIWL